MYSARDVFRNFIGTWNIRRVLGTYGRGEGVARFTLSSNSPSELIYHEELHIVYADSSKGVGGTAHQEYRYIYDEGKDRIVKRFSDGRHFYDLNLNFNKEDKTTCGGCGEHLCIKDLYKAKYIFGKDKDSFTLMYDVQGPEKDYVIETEFQREKDEVEVDVEKVNY